MGAVPPIVWISARLEALVDAPREPRQHAPSAAGTRAQRTRFEGFCTALGVYSRRRGTPLPLSGRPQQAPYRSFSQHSALRPARTAASCSPVRKRRSGSEEVKTELGR